MPNRVFARRKFRDIIFGMGRTHKEQLELANEIEAAKSKIREAFTTLLQSGGKLGNLEVDAAASEARAKALETAYQTRDGVKLYLKDGSWCLVRP